MRIVSGYDARLEKIDRFIYLAVYCSAIIVLRCWNFTLIPSVRIIEYLHILGGNLQMETDVFARWTALPEEIRCQSVEIPRDIPQLIVQYRHLTYDLITNLWDFRFTFPTMVRYFSTYVNFAGSFRRGDKTLELHARK